ncbi:MAG: LytTR family DNA-binding domain-containing protein [Crocinitomicaceae bacterium]|nr:response regulator transcription factor [Crocinitomicaceae bacterium]
MEKAVVVEDELHVRNGIISMIQEYCPEIEVVASAGTVQQGYEKIAEFQPDIVFLDVNLPDGSGFDLLEKIVRNNLKVIFITAYSEHALKAIKHSAIDYLLKPLIPEELIEAVNKATRFILQEKTIDKLNAQDDTSDKGREKKIIIKTQTESFYLNVDQIVYFKADGNYSEVITSSNKPILVAKTLKFYEDVMQGYGFLRVHQSYLVNSNHILGLNGNKLQLKNGNIIEISRRKRVVIQDLFKK